MSKVPLEPMVIIPEPFSRVAIYLVGPFTTRSAQANRQILTMIDFSTGWSGFHEAVPLKE